MNLPPSGNNGFMLGLILGLKAGLISTFEPALMLPPLLLPLRALMSLPNCGVVALCGEVMAEINGLDVALPGRFMVEEAVLRGPSFGVFRA